MRGISDKVVIIVGGGSGIGAATAERLGREGAIVVIGDVNGPQVEKTVVDLKAIGVEALGLSLDITQEESIISFLSIVIKKYGRLNGVHLNAAEMSLLPEDTDVQTIPMSVFDRTIEVNLRGHFMFTRHLIPILMENNGGSIVYTTSAAAFMGEPLRVAYSIAKNGLHALIRHVASRWGKQGIRANGVAPGLIELQVPHSINSNERNAVLAITRSPRLGVPADIAAMVCYLMSEDASWINGQVYSVDGGVTFR